MGPVNQDRVLQHTRDQSFVAKGFIIKPQLRVGFTTFFAQQRAHRYPHRRNQTH